MNKLITFAVHTSAIICFSKWVNLDLRSIASNEQLIKSFNLTRSLQAFQSISYLSKIGLHIDMF
jgi:hypothetical protein